MSCTFMLLYEVLVEVDLTAPHVSQCWISAIKLWEQSKENSGQGVRIWR